MKWYYSEKLQLYISLEPLKINNQVFRIAKDYHITLDWDDHGNIVMLDFAEFKTLVRELGGVILSPTQYWQLYQEACEKNCDKLKESLMSPQFTEILDRVYVDDNTYIDHCEIVGPYEYEGNRVNYEPVVGRPGWITVEDIDIRSGHPMQIHENDPAIPQMKYWSADLSNTSVKKTFSLRGYVTSVAMPSLDLGIPTDTRQPKMMVRFCCKELPKELKDIQKKEIGRLLSFDEFSNYILSGHKLLKEALRGEKMITFVTGHKNPDADTVISSAFESYRRHLNNSDPNMVYLPLVQSKYMPKEISYILGERLANKMIYSECESLDAWLKTGKIRFVFTDQNYQKEFQKYVIAIIDHHKMNTELENGSLEIPCQIEMLGSCTALIVRNCLEKGYDFDAQLSKILYSAMLMDTENRVPHKMTQNDVVIMDKFRKKAEITSDDTLYELIMSRLISETDADRLYRRDYKHYYGFGFSVLKVTNRMDEPGLETWLETAFSIAREDNQKNNDYFTLIKLVDYKPGGLQVHKERIYWIWHLKENRYLMEKLQDLIYQLVKYCMPNGEITCGEHYIEISKTGKQVSRKKIVPAIEVLIACCGQYTFSECLGKWVAKDFLKANDAVRAVFPDIKTDEKGRVCHISFLQAKKLTQQLGIEMLSLKDYWNVYEEAGKKHDTALASSLVDSDFLEFLDTWYKEAVLVHKPMSQDQEISDAEILYANPGLISPSYIDKETGLPNHIFSAANYYDKSLWRYWSPMQDKTYIFSRSYIFLLQQPCLDAKSTPNESFANMGIRPVRKDNLNVDVLIETTDKTLVIRYKSEYDMDYKVVYEA